MPNERADNARSRADKLGVLSRKLAAKGLIGGSDAVDYYQFKLARSSTVKGVLKNLKADADLRLFDRQGRTLKRSTKRGNSSELFERELDRGVYYLKVSAKSREPSTRYRLILKGQSVPLPLPVPTSEYFTFSYAYGNGDYYTGDGYASVGTYYAGLVQPSPSTNETGTWSSYLITSVADSFNTSAINRVTVRQYYDSEEGILYTLNATVTSGLGSESGTFLSGDRESYFDWYSEGDRTPSPLPSPTPYIRLTSPNGSDQWVSGNSYNLTWQDNIDDNVNLILYKGSTPWYSLSSSTASDGSFTWTVPTSITSGSDYRLRIASVANSNLYDQSDAVFTIQPAPVNSGDQYYTYRYRYGNGDTYTGYGYTTEGRYSAGQVITDSGLNETSNQGSYIILNATNTSSSTTNTNRVWVTSYYDSESGQTRTPVSGYGSSGLGSESGYLISGKVGTYFGDRYAEADLPVLRYGYTYVYDGTYSSSATEESYSGYVYGYDGKYQFNTYYDVSSNPNETGQNGRYYIVGLSELGAESDIGKVTVSSYRNTENGLLYTPYSGSGSNFLGSEWGYLTSSQTTANDRFGSDYYEADIPAYADLKGDYFGIQSSLNAGNTFDSTFRIRNDGNANAGSFNVEFYLSKNSTITTSDRLLGAYTLSSLNSGVTTSSLTQSLTLPDFTNSFWSSSGTYYIGMRVDASNAVSESNETNNASQGIGLDWDSVSINISTSLKKYWFYYNYNPSNYQLADSYIGSVIAPEGKYVKNEVYDPNSNASETGINGKYVVYDVQDYNNSLISEMGRVFVNDYIDRDNGKEIILKPVIFMNNGGAVQPNGLSYLGSEVDYLYSSKLGIYKFGADYFEADPDWFDINLADSGLISTARSLYADNSFSRNEMISIFQHARDGSVIDSIELTDLRRLVGNTANIFMPNYVRVLSNKVANVHVANAKYKNTTLGNLRAGSSSTHLDKLIDKWFLGGDRPMLTTADRVYAYANGALFQNGINYQDIAQGNIGDCYFLAGLAGTALRAPSTIQSMFIDNGDNTYTVRFYQSDGTEDFVTVDRYLPSQNGRFTYAHQVNALSWGNLNDPSNELWVALAEKAYAQMQEGGMLRGPSSNDTTNSYEAIESGYGGGAISDVTGRATRVETLNLSDFNALVTAYTQNRWVYFSSKESGTASNIVASHGYVLVGYNASTQKFKLFNPWGIYGGTKDGVLKPGHVELTMTELVSNFQNWFQTTT